jgi:hypothetical protein
MNQKMSLHVPPGEQNRTAAIPCGGEGTTQPPSFQPLVFLPPPGAKTIPKTRQSILSTWFHNVLDWTNARIRADSAG